MLVAEKVEDLTDNINILEAVDVIYTSRILESLVTSDNVTDAVRHMKPYI